MTEFATFFDREVKFQYDNTLREPGKGYFYIYSKFKFQYDNTLSDPLRAILTNLKRFKFQYDNTLR